MKRIITIIFVVVLTTAYSQSPSGINYQSIIRNSAGTMLPSTAVVVEFKLYNGLAGSLVYDESHNTSTNSFGMANLIIGQGTPITGTFNTINWVNGIAYEVYVNSNLVGTKQLFMSVPYALFSSTPPLNLSGSVLTSGPTSNSVTLNTGASTTLTPASSGNVSIIGVAPSYTVGAPSYSLSSPLGNNLFLSNGVNTSVISIPSPSLGLINGILSVRSNTINLLNPINGFWGVKGNIGTVSGTNYIGTSDVVDLNFRTSAINRMTIASTGSVNINSDISIPAVNSYSYNSAKTNYYSIPAQSFSSEKPKSYLSDGIVSQIFSVPTSTLPLGFATYFTAPVNLPNGATITKLDAYVIDNSSGANISVAQLWRSDSPVGGAGNGIIIGTAGPTIGTNANIQVLTDNSIATPVVDNLNYAYYVRFGGAYAGLGAEQDIKLVRFLITYTVSKTD